MTIRDFEWVNPFWTAGSIYAYIGKLKNGNWFITADSDCWLDELNVNPNDYDNDDIWQSSWIDEHSMKSYDHYEAKQFFKAMYRWIIKNKPSNEYTNYDIGDIETLLKTIDKWFPES